jgi:cysteinyl-tRNA synthetase
MQAGARVEVRSDKRHPADFALWKEADESHIMQWPSPWGKGFPGWHIECTVMSRKYLGDSLDIHGGGLENQFPHHDCEIAQAEAAGAGEQGFVKYWLHNNMVTVDGQKMGKSLGNFITLKQLFSGEHEKLSSAYDPMIVRQFVLTSHYRSPSDFSDEALRAARSGYQRLTNCVLAIRGSIEGASAGETDSSSAEKLREVREEFTAAMNDDFNTSVAMGSLFQLVDYANGLLAEGSASKGTLEEIDATFRELGGNVLGIVLEEYPQAGGSREAELVQLLIDLRAEARERKDYTVADSIRDRLKETGVILEDKKEGTTWRLGGERA